MLSQATLETDTQGRSFLRSSVLQLQMLGVERVYDGPVIDPDREDIAHLIHQNYYVPAESHRRVGIVYISHEALEAALWHLRHNSVHLKMARALLLSILRFDAWRPYEIYADPDRRVYSFVTLSVGVERNLPRHCQETVML